MLLTEDQVVDLLKARIRDLEPLATANHRSAREEFALRHGVTQGQISKALNGSAEVRTRFEGRVLRVLGVEKITAYRRMV